jgi:hypothetical protein
MAKVSISAAVREILGADPSLPTDEVIKKVQAKGVTAPVESIRHGIHNLRKEFRKPAKPAPTKGSSPKAVVDRPPTPVKAAVAAAPIQVSTPVNDLAGIFTNVALVNKVRTLCGGTENAKQVAEAVRACGGVDAFLQHLDLVTGITQDGSKA